MYEIVPGFLSNVLVVLIVNRIFRQDMPEIDEEQVSIDFILD